MSSTSFNQTLQFITSVKLAELEKQRAAFHAHAKVIDEANALGRSSIERVERLLAAVRSAPSAGAASSTLSVAGGVSLANLDLWIAQAKSDPSISPAQIAGWADALEQHLRHSEASFDYARLFGQLFTEWLQSADTSTPASNDSGESAQEDFEEVDRKELHEQRAEFEARVFDTPPAVYAERLRNYMEELFRDNRDATLALEGVRERVQRFGKYFSETRVTAHALKDTIENLLRQDLLNNEKRATLAEFARNDTVLQEVASVLNMHLSRIGTWRWPEEGVAVEMRRALNGKYRFFMDEEVLLALFLHHIGLAWSLLLKAEFKSFLYRGWKPTVPQLSADVRQQRKELLGEENPTSIEHHRQAYQKTKAFLAQLPDSVKSGAGYDDDGSGYGSHVANPKQVILDRVNTEMLINRTIYGSFTVLLSDFEWFGPSLSFDVILTVLDFFGVPDDWLHFFRTFLQAPLRFKGDPAGTAPRTRLRGTPIGHSLSMIMGECLLFVMDFAVNQRADGLFLYRIHDDLWLWDHDARRVLKGWQEMQRFADIAGLKFNVPKTGSATVGGADLEGLPAGDVRWGFLKLDPHAAQFVVDEAMVEKHIEELQRQLDSAQSVFGVVNRFNYYIRFIARNLGGQPSRSFGVAHIDAMVAALSRVERSLFPGSSGGILGHLKGMLAKRFGVADPPLGWFFIPNALGGLGLHNPLVELLAIRKNSLEDPAGSVMKVLLDEADVFRRHQEVWEQNLTAQRQRWQHFDLTFEQYVEGRENAIVEWGWEYDYLLEYPSPHSLDATSQVKAATKVLEQWPANETFKKYTNFDSLEFYDRWIMALYCEELTAKFGSFAIVDPALIPVGMLEVFQSTKVRWEQ